MKYYLLGLLMMVYSAASFAQAWSYSDTPDLPDGPVSPLVQPLLKTINSGDANQVEVFIKQHFATSLRDRYPMAMHINMALDLNANFGELSFHSVRTYSQPLPATDLDIILKAALTESWRGISISVSDKAPHKIVDLRFSPARTPSNLPEPEPLSLEQAVAELEAYVGRLAKRDVFSGAVLLAKQDTVLFSAAHGLASKRFNVANNLQTKFNLGSMNKMFTSVAIMQLVQAGKLSLTDTLDKFADESWLPKEVSSKIEIQHLLTHSSGLGSYFNRDYAESSKNLFRELADYKRLVENEIPRFEPGTDNRYSNTGMLMLGVVIEAVSGLDYFSYVQKHIYKPAGMVNSDSYEMDQPVPNLAIGYERDHSAETGWRNNLYIHVLKGGPAGGGFSTVEDLHRFALALMQYRLLNKNFSELSYSPKPELYAFGYGYGFDIDGSVDNRIVGHGGGFAGISANLGIHLDKGYIAVVLSNIGGGSRPIQTKIKELLARVKD